jgi:hypothetical protein
MLKENAMWLRGRLLSCVGLMLVIPLRCEAQGRLPLLERALPEAVTAAGPYSSLRATQASGPRSGGRDSLLNGTVIGFAVGAALGITYAYAVRDSDLDVGQYAYSALIFGGIGAGVGLGIDALFDRNSSVVGGSPRRVALSPRVSRKTAGVRVTMRW